MQGSECFGWHLQKKHRRPEEILLSDGKER